MFNISYVFIFDAQMKMFMDYSSGGSLCVIFANVFKTKMEQGW